MDMTSDIKSTNSLTIGEKIRILRTAKEITQAELAENIWSSASQVSRMENKWDACKPKEIEAIKKYFGIVDMPLTDFERETFKERLYAWCGLIRDQKLDEARELHKKMLPILSLEPCDPELAIHFRLFEILLLQTEGESELADEKLDYLQDCIDKMNNELKYHYYHRMGTSYAMRRDNENALKYYLQAYELTKILRNIPQEDIERLYLNIASRYTNLELPNRAIMFLTEIRKTDTNKRTTPIDIGLDVALASSYIRISEFQEAEKILTKNLVRAKGIDDNYCTYVVLYYLGSLYRYTENWKKSIDYYDQALEIVDVSSDFHLWSLYYKIRCLIGNRSFSKAEKMLEEAKQYYVTKDSKSITLKSLEHFLLISKSITTVNEESTEYIKTVAIPHLIDNHTSLEAISYYELLEQHYKKTRNIRKSLYMAAEMRDIYKRLFANKKGGNI